MTFKWWLVKNGKRLVVALLACKGITKLYAIAPAALNAKVQTPLERL